VDVSVQKNLGTLRRPGGRNMREMKLHPFAFEIERHRPFEMRIAISQNDVQRDAEAGKFVERFGRADVAKVPKLIGAAEQRRKTRRISIVRVRKNRDAHFFPSWGKLPALDSDF
jgi:hypothetical protein